MSTIDGDSRVERSDVTEFIGQKRDKFNSFPRSIRHLANLRPVPNVSTQPRYDLNVAFDTIIPKTRIRHRRHGSHSSNRRLQRRHKPPTKLDVTCNVTIATTMTLHQFTKMSRAMQAYNCYNEKTERLLNLVRREDDLTSLSTVLFPTSQSASQKVASPTISSPTFVDPTFHVSISPHSRLTTAFVNLIVESDNATGGTFARQTDVSANTFPPFPLPPSDTRPPQYRLHGGNTPDKDGLEQIKGNLSSGGDSENSQEVNSVAMDQNSIISDRVINGRNTGSSFNNKHVMNHRNRPTGSSFNNNNNSDRTSRKNSRRITGRSLPHQYAGRDERSERLADVKSVIQNVKRNNHSENVTKSIVHDVRIRRRCRFIRKYNQCKREFMEKVFFDDHGVPISWPKQIVDVMDTEEFVMMYY